ncbi:MAG TPA: glycosyltransferase [Bacteriovoracaceae bacterium]|nr:glycosyltransferase [Bacteriovoracaceae bacterium]
MLLLTTPDYLPKLGGLCTHTLNVEKVLKELSIPYELFNWKNYQDILSFPQSKLDKFEYILNIHSGFCMHAPKSKAKVINFICGAEILFYSPNMLKHLIKQITRKKGLIRVEEAQNNIFISDFTFQTLIQKGLKPDYARDLIFHMCVDTNGHRFLPKDWDSPLKFICVARNVPHKNFVGAIKFCEYVQEVGKRPVEFITVTDTVFKSDKIKITSHINPDNAERDELLKEAHINLLLSLDHSKTGFFEGFGQIVQEAGMFATPSLVLATGGLPESVHHGESGWVLPDLDAGTVEAWWKSMSAESYSRISKRCYKHTIDSHGLDNWKRLFQVLLK